jgi:hypothetical protein
MRTAIGRTLILLALLSESAGAQRINAVLGSRIDLTLRGGRRLSGELIAAQHDSVWLLARAGTFSVLALGEVARARVPRRGMSGGTVLAWALVGGLVSGVALSAACNSVEGADCGAVFAGVTLSWALVGGAAAAMAGSSTRSLPVEGGALAPYSRFPQGIPDGFLPRPAPSPSPSRLQGTGAPGLVGRVSGGDILLPRCKVSSSSPNRASRSSWC